MTQPYDFSEAEIGSHQRLRVAACELLWQIEARAEPEQVFQQLAIMGHSGLWFQFGCKPPPKKDQPKEHVFRILFGQVLTTKQAKGLYELQMQKIMEINIE